MSDDILEFPGDDELRPPSGTRVNLQVRMNDDGGTPDLSGRTSDYGPFVSVQCEAVDGQYKGFRASLIYNIDPKNHKFRSIIHAVTGVDVTKGEKVSLSEFNEKFLSGIFLAEIGPEKRKGEETGYTAVEKLIERVGDRDGAVADVPVEAAVADEEDEDDVPF